MKNNNSERLGKNVEGLTAVAKNVLYISYDGMTDPLGQSQVLSYLYKLANARRTFHVLSYEKLIPFGLLSNELRLTMQKSGLSWDPLPYSKFPPVFSTLFDISEGVSRARDRHRSQPLNVIHARGYISAIIATRLKKLYGIPWIFDMRGWWADEKLESGNWRNPLYRPVYKYFKSLERHFFKNAEHIVSLTDCGRQEITRISPDAASKISVIPTCVNFNAFPPFDEQVRRQTRVNLGLDEKSTVLVYSGTMGGNYSDDLLMTVFRCFQSLKPSAKLLILTKSNPGPLATDPDVLVANLEYSQVGNYLMAADIACINYKASYSLIGRSPTKLGEYWSCGLPVISPEGVGDVDELLRKCPIGGATFSSTSSASLRNAIERCLNAPTDRSCLRQCALDYYNLEIGVNKYAQIYDQLLYSSQL